ncbi:similar to Saccharomyces cerevisiae YKL190W CNB1 Calcineurin B [Maudiozyma barnettii]|uniref:Calcineurin subunit B n=1 Tax=Maudiozyma barnettii TaxID=61262 RepID=A0A8H2ZJP6_9SACH|nr:calcineurin regulatory subunit B [Kazachstania barnettii]CAB4256188.1 similar to Saccharomyces cerevisiae YKL190W CNB1 Calcineurin B [Kazachstania barnettii]CAD1784796.1 similar to Saccharomyces cerevisiae YKL190W CNB1 Calcineurin B [Kazachstania barnettii]
MGGTPSKIVDSLLEDTNFDRDEIERLRKRFMKLDRDSSGSIDKNEFMSIPGVSSNPLAARIMEVFDTDNSGDVDFQEFITGLSIFSGRGSKDDKLNFAFKIYDIDKDGYISNGELFIVLKIMVGNNLDDEQLQQIVDRTIMENDNDGDGRLDFQEFKNAIETTEVIKSLTLKYDV